MPQTIFLYVLSHVLLLSIFPREVIKVRYLVLQSLLSHMLQTPPSPPPVACEALTALESGGTGSTRLSASISFAPAEELAETSLVSKRGFLSTTS